MGQLAGGEGFQMQLEFAQKFKTYNLLRLELFGWTKLWCGHIVSYEMTFEDNSRVCA